MIYLNRIKKKVFDFKMKKLLMYTALLSVPFFAQAKEESKWENTIRAEDSKYSFVSTIKKEKNNFDYICSVFKFNGGNFGKVESINIDLDLKLEEDKLNFQDSYDVQLVFSNGKMFKNNLKLNHSKEGLDRFTLFLSGDGSDNDIIKNLSNRNYVNVEVYDNKNKRVLYRFYLNNSYKSIRKTQDDCHLLFNTFN